MAFLFGSIISDAVDKHLSLLTQLGTAEALAGGGGAAGRAAGRAALLLPHHQREQWGTPGCATWCGKLQNKPNSWETLAVK